MNFHIVYDNLALDLRELQEFFLNMKIEGCHVFFSPLPADPEDRIQVIVEKSNRDFILKVPQLDFVRRSSFQDLLNTIKNTIISCSGHKKSTLTGLTVRDGQGNKFRPEIDIYAPKDLLVEFPDTLEYVKAAVSAQKTLPSKKKVYFHSEILSAILAHAPLSFKAHGETYELAMENDTSYMYYSARPPGISIDFLTCYTVSRDLLDVINSRSGPISSYLSSIVSYEDKLRPKGLLRSLAKHKKSMDYVLEVVENAPKFQDSRDGIFDELRDFLVSSHHKETVGKYEYLEVVRQTIPKNKNRFSLGKFLDP